MVLAPHSRRRLARIVAALAAFLVLLGAAYAWLRGARRTAPERPLTHLAIRITDRASGAALAGRVLLFDSADEAIHIGRNDLYGKRQARASCPIAAGVVGTWDGLVVAPGAADIPIGADDCEPSPAIPHGRYRVWAWHGLEYELWRGEVDLTAPGRVTLAIALERAWTPHGTLAADLHVHALRSNDSGVPGPVRVLTQIAAGVAVIGLSDHNASGDLDAEIAELGLERIVTSIASNELTAVPAHIGVLPVPFDRRIANGGSPADAVVAKASIEELFEIAAGFPGDPLVQLNHPRFRYAALFDSTKWDGVSWPPPFPLRFDAMEVLAGHTAFNHQTDRRIDESVRDLYTFVDHGVLIAATGNSDTHHTNGVHDALARNYVFVDPPTVFPFDEGAFVAALRARRVVATTGPWLDVEVASREGDAATVGTGQALPAASGAVWVELELAQASFVAADRIRIVVGAATGPSVVRELAVPAGQRRFRWRGAVEVGAVDTWLGVDAGGDTPLPVELTGTYQIEKKRAGVTPYALINPILVDADGDGRWRRGEADLALPPGSRGDVIGGAPVAPPRPADVRSPGSAPTPPAPAGSGPAPP